jgi:hypothetical protein
MAVGVFGFRPEALAQPDAGIAVPSARWSALAQVDWGGVDDAAPQSEPHVRARLGPQPGGRVASTSAPGQEALVSGPDLPPRCSLRQAARGHRRRDPAATSNITASQSYSQSEQQPNSTNPMKWFHGHNVLQNEFPSSCLSCCTDCMTQLWCQRYPLPNSTAWSVP